MPLEWVFWLRVPVLLLTARGLALTPTPALSMIDRVADVILHWASVVINDQ